jgi:hypothetical protein
MRSRKSLFVLGLVGVLGAMVALSGCSNDDRPTPPVLTINDQYSYVQTEVNDVVDEAITLMGMTLTMFESNSQVTDSAVSEDLRESPFDPDEVFSSNDWYILISDHLSSAYGSRVIDSIAFTSNGAPVEFAKDANGIVVRHLYDYANVNTEITYTNYETRGRLTFSGLNTDQATISGGWSAYTIAQVVDGTAEVRTYTIEADINSLVVSKPEDGWAGGCPTSGSIAFSVQLSYDNDMGQNEQSTWDFTVSFTDGVGQVAVSDGTVTTSYNHSFCAE